MSALERAIPRLLRRRPGAIVWMLQTCAIDPPQVCRWILHHSMRATG
jgi:hypothetical protein